MSVTTIHDIGVALGTYLIAKGCPIPVVDGPELKRTSWNPERIVIEHDVDGKDSFSGPRGLHTNAKHRHTATDAYKVTIYAQSKVTGPKPFEHRTRAKAIREMVMTGLATVAAANKNAWEPESGAFVSPPDIAESEQPNGAGYEIKFTYDLPIRFVTFANAAVTEGTLAAMTSTTVVGRAGIADDDDDPTTPQAGAETACGA